MVYNFSKDFKVSCVQHGIFLAGTLLNCAQGMTESGHPHGAIQTFYDFHAGNFFDPITWGSISRVAPLVLNKNYIKDPSRTVKINTRCVFAAAATGIAYEAYQAQLPHREFETVDCGMYLAGALAFAALSKLADISFKPDPAP